MSKNYVVTIDGPSGVGKSTLAKALAEKLNIAYLDTGAMYRTFSLYISMHSLNTLDLTHYSDELLKSVLQKIRFSLVNKILLCNNEPIPNKIYTEDIAALTTKLAKYAVVREYMQNEQAQIAQNSSIIADGRDMGTKVFPNALCKIFLDAKPEVRAKRRYDELIAKGHKVDFDEIQKQMIFRDNNDKNRELDPLIAAHDAYIVDSSAHSAEEILLEIYKLVQNKLATNFSHIDSNGDVCMVDVGKKFDSERRAVVKSEVLLSAQTLKLLQEKALPKGDVLTTAKIAGIMAAKKCADLIPMCHPLNLNYVDVNFTIQDNPPAVLVEAEVRTDGKTGVEMEALIACQIASATIYDMCKAVQKDILITNTRLTHKSGGKSGDINFK